MYLRKHIILKITKKCLEDSQVDRKKQSFKYKYMANNRHIPKRAMANAVPTRIPMHGQLQLHHNCANIMLAFDQKRGDHPLVLMVEEVTMEGSLALPSGIPCGKPLPNSC